MTELRSDRANLIGVVERREGVGRFEFREDKSTGQIILEGYAATFEKYDVHGGPAAGGWVEQLSKRAFDTTLAEQPDVQLLINHTGTPLARTKSGTLKLSSDQHGLRVWASLDASDPDVKALIPKMRRKDMDEMSFAFRVQDQTWDTSYSHRMINSLTLEKGDVSVVNYGMNPGTRAVIADAVGALSQLSNKELVELRKLDVDQVKRAAAALVSISAGDVPQGLGSIRPQPMKRKNAEGKSGGGVMYADPGYKADGKKRYPIDTEDHCRAAWSYINMPKNQKGYTATQVNAIKSRVKARAEKLNIKISEEKSETGLSHIEQVQRADGNVSLVAVMADGSKVPLPSTKRANDNSYGQWSPNNGPDNPQDPHDRPYKVGAMGLVDAGPVPGNIQGGKLIDQKPVFSKPQPEKDPHDTSTQELSMDNHDDSYDFGPYPAGSKIKPANGNFTGEGGGDPHEEPYSVGGEVGSVPDDRPNYGGAKGKPADNIIVQGTGRVSGGVNVPVANPVVGTEPVVAPGHQAYDWTTGPLEPSDPKHQYNGPHDLNPAPQNLDDALRSMDAEMYGSDEMCGTDPHDGPTLGGPGPAFSPGSSWEPTNIRGEEEECYDEMGADEEDKEECDDGEMMSIDLGMAEALERTIVHCYQLSDSLEVRKRLVVARRQLLTLTGKKPIKVGTSSDVNNKLSELRKEIGAPDTGTVSEGLAYLRSAGSAPVGYRGVLDQDPNCRVTSPAERLAREVIDKRARAKTLDGESQLAEQRLKAAQREAELNDVIRRHRKVV